MMFTRLAAATVSVAALLASGVQAQDNSTAGLQIYSPGGDQFWWVANSLNVFSWTCNTSPVSTFSVVLANQNPTQWAPLTFIAIQNNDVCSQQIAPNAVAAPAGTGYLLQFADVNNRTNILASSQPFEIKPVGSAYPATTASPPGASTVASAGPSASAGNSASITGSAGAAQNTQKPNGASKAAIGGVATVAAAALGLFFA